MKSILRMARILGLLLALMAAGIAHASAVRTTGFSFVDLPRNDDQSTGQVNLPFPVNFYGQQYSNLYVNNNGNVTFDAPMYTFTPFGLIGTQRKIIAPFFADVDTRSGGQPVRYSYGSGIVDGRRAFAVNWVDVGYYSQHFDKTNSFQLVLISRPELGPDACIVEFNYDRIRWETGDASGGSNGFGGSSARAGFSNGTGTLGTFFEFPGSGANGGLLDGNSATGLVNHSLGSAVQGRYIFVFLNLSYPTVNGQWPYPSYMPPSATCNDGCPVDLATGEERHPADDDLVSVGPTGVRGSFSRTYFTTRAKMAYASPGLSEGWVHNYDDRVLPTAPGTWSALLLQPASGGQEALAPKYDANGYPTGEFFVRDGVPFRVSGLPGTTTGVWQSLSVTYEDGSTRGYVPQAGGTMVLESITDSLGRVVHVTVVNGRVQSVEDVGSGRTLLTMVYDANGLLAQVSDHAGRKRCYTYTVPGSGIAVPCLTAVSRIGVLADANLPDEVTYGYASFNGHPLIASIGGPSPTRQGQSVISFMYNPATGKVTTQTAPNGRTHNYTYGAGNTQVTIRDAQGSLLSSRTEYFDQLGRRLGVGDSQAHRTTMEYGDPSNPCRPTRIVDREGSGCSYTYDAYGHVRQETDLRGLTTEYTYDYSVWPMGRLVRVQAGTRLPTTYTYLEPSGLVKTVSTPLPGSGAGIGTTTYTYDFEADTTKRFGRVVQVQRPGNEAAAQIMDTYTYDYTDDPSYDADGNPGTYHTASSGRPLTMTDKRGRTTHFRYDACGNVVLMIDAEGRRIDRLYNLANQPTQVTLPPEVAGGGRRRIVTDYTYAGGVAWRVTAYDASNQVVQQEVTTYDVSGSILSRAGGEDPVSYEYDALGRKTKTVDGGGHATSYNYNADNQLAQVTYPDGHSVQYTSHDFEGNVLDMVDGNGVRTEFSYDTSGAVTQVDHTDTAGADVTLTYDEFGNIVFAYDREGLTASEYDGTGRLIRSARLYSGMGQALSVSYDYNADGSLKRMDTPAGTFHYEYDADGRLVGLTNPAGRTSRWTYRADDLLQMQGLGNRTWTRYEYDGLGQIIGQTNHGPRGQVLSEYRDISRDGLGRLTSMNVSLPGMPGFSGVQSYAYDGRGELVRDQWTPQRGMPTSLLTASYDSAGNLMRGPRDPQSYIGMERAYNAANQWVGYRDAQGAVVGGELFAYDGNGNPTTYRGNHLAFDSDNRLTEFAAPAGEVRMRAGYLYNGLRAWKESGGRRVYFIYAGSKPVCEVGTDGSIAAYTTWAPAGLLGRTDCERKRETWYLLDPLGNVSQRTDVGGQVTSTDRYDAWGNLQAGGDATDPYGYRAKFGYYTDHETGLILCGQRYYDPQAGRWLTRDPIGELGGANLYRYCGGDPANKVDPNGKFGECAVIGTVACPGVGTGVGLAIDVLLVVGLLVISLLAYNSMQQAASLPPPPPPIVEPAPRPAPGSPTVEPMPWPSWPTGPSTPSPGPSSPAPSGPSIPTPGGPVQPGAPSGPIQPFPIPWANPDPISWPQRTPIPSPSQPVDRPWCPPQPPTGGQPRRRNPQEVYVVRGGKCLPEVLVTGAGWHSGVPGLYGLSVQSAPGKSLAQLAAALPRDYGQISYTTVRALSLIAVPVVPSPGIGFHCTAQIVPAPLTIERASVISEILVRAPNPARVR